MKKKKRFFLQLQGKEIGKLIIHPGLSIFVLAAIIFCAIFAPFLTPHDPYKGSIYDQFIPPMWMEGGSAKYILGTDYFGRDLLTRLLYGARVTAVVAGLTICVAAVIGTFLGLFAAYRGGLADMLTMRIAESVIAIPYLVVAIIITVTLGNGFFTVVFIMSGLQWPFYAKYARAEGLVIRESDYVALAKVAGASHFSIIYNHFFLNIVPTLLIYITLSIGMIILWEATLSFLGLGIPSPIPSWGLMISDGRNFLVTKWWLSLIPGIAILLTVLAANIFGDWLRDHLDPKLRQL